MDKENTLKKLDELIEARSILKHPFYVAWNEGMLTQEQLALYARVYYPHVAAFPRYIESALGEAKNQRVRQELSTNLEDELSNPRPHTELWLDFAEALGLERESVNGVPPEIPAVQMVDTFTRLSHSGSGAALAALYAYEAQQPGVARVKADGLRQMYGMEDERGTVYFEVHAEADLLHREGERRALDECLSNGTSADEVIAAAEAALNAYWSLLDGICELAQVPLA